MNQRVLQENEVLDETEGMRATWTDNLSDFYFSREQLVDVADQWFPKN